MDTLKYLRTNTSKKTYQLSIPLVPFCIFLPWNFHQLSRHQQQLLHTLSFFQQSHRFHWIVQPVIFIKLHLIMMKYLQVLPIYDIQYQVIMYPKLILNTILQLHTILFEALSCDEEGCNVGVESFEILLSIGLNPSSSAYKNYSTTLLQLHKI